ncbi:MAG: metallophosphoesterase [Planctomycetota bacterium]|jgi:3',5'-cyclic AMP phosphodiesterase CpdA|nr:metallophosphoesterase [Planctomycetota bacterium]
MSTDRGLTTVAHISDLHIARRPPWSQLNFKRLLGYVNYNVSRRIRHRESSVEGALVKLARLRPDLVIASGDLTQLGLDGELLELRDLLLGLKDTGIPVFIAPGNHDCYAGFHPEALADLRRELSLGHAPDDHGIHHFPGVDILILDQGIPTPPFAAYGRTKAGELEAASGGWADPPSGVSRLVSGHFPVASRGGGKPKPLHGLIDWREMRMFLRGHSVAAYLCGHDHKRYRVELPGGCVQYVAPALPLDDGVDVYECSGDGVKPLPPL